MRMARRDRSDLHEDALDPGAGMTLDQLGDLIELARARGIDGAVAPRVTVNWRGRIKTFSVQAKPDGRAGPGAGRALAVPPLS